MNKAAELLNKQTQAFDTMVKAIQKAQAKGVYTLQESSAILTAIVLLKKSNEAAIKAHNKKQESDVEEI